MKDLSYIRDMPDNLIANCLNNRHLLERTDENSAIIREMEDAVIHRGIEHLLK